MFKNNEELIEYLKSTTKEELKEFNAKIIPTTKPFIGVNLPRLRSIAKDGAKNLYPFLSLLSDKYFEEIMLFGMAIGYAKVEYEERIRLLRKYLPLCDNWAHIDSAVSTYKFIIKDRENFLVFIKENLNGEEFFVRFSIVCLIDYFVEEEYLSFIFNTCEDISLEKYYVSMAVAWLISICYVKFPKETEKWLKTSKIDHLTYNRAIQKICDSKRVDNPSKDILKKLKRKI